MKNFNNSYLAHLIKSKILILMAGAFLMSSCTVYTGGYSETDGVYYDPNKDSLPAGTYPGNYGNRIDEYYNFQDSAPSIYDNNQLNIQEQQNRYRLNTDSDWGFYTGTETYYNSFNTWGYGVWGYPAYGFYYWNSPFNSWSWGLGFGWGYSFYSPWVWGPGFYSPFWGYGYGWGGYYGGYYHPIYYNRSGTNGRLNGMITPNRSGSRNGTRYAGINSSGFRGSRDVRTQLGTANSSIRSSNNANGIRINNSGIRNYPNGNVRTYPNSSGVRSQNYPNTGGVRTTPNYGGGRNGTYTSPSRSGNFGGSPNYGGGMRSGGSSGGGGMRSGGGGRR